MPYESKAQQRAMHAKAERGEIDKETIREFDEATKNQPGGFDALPEKKEKKESKSEKKSELTCAAYIAGLHTALKGCKHG